jgi:hypothetical protein
VLLEIGKDPRAQALEARLVDEHFEERVAANVQSG